MIKLEELLHNSMAAAVDFNDSNQKNMGVAFIDNGNESVALIASGAYAIRVDGVEKAKTPFFSYSDNMFTEYRYPMLKDDILKLIGATWPKTGAVYVPIGNLVNYVDSVYKEERKISGGMAATALTINGMKSRFVFTKQDKRIQKGEVLAKFKNVDGKKVFYYDGADMPFVISSRSHTPEEAVEEGVFYKCRVESFEKSKVVLDVIERYGSVFIGYIYSPGIFRLADSVKISASDLMSYSFSAFEGNYEAVPTMHFDTSVIKNVLSVFRCLPFDTMLKIEFPEINEVIPISGEHSAFEDILARVSSLPIVMTAESEIGAIRAVVGPLKASSDYQIR